jgi:phosphoglycerate kinase
LAPFSKPRRAARHLVTRVDHLIIGGGLLTPSFRWRARRQCRQKPANMSRLAHARGDTEAADKANCTVQFAVRRRRRQGSSSRSPRRAPQRKKNEAADEMISRSGPAAVESRSATPKNCRTWWNGPLEAFDATSLTPQPSRLLAL